MAQEKKSSKVGLGLGLATAAIAGAYFLYGSKEGAKRRMKIKGWTLRAKGEVLERLENLKDVNQEKYDAIVDSVAEKYKKVKGVDTSEVSALAKDLKYHWGNIKKQIHSVAKDVAKPSKKKPASRKKSAKKQPKREEE